MILLRHCFFCSNEKCSSSDWHDDEWKETSPISAIMIMEGQLEQASLSNGIGCVVRQAIEHWWIGNAYSDMSQQDRISISTIIGYLRTI
jgi:hypothetical protein